MLVSHGDMGMCFCGYVFRMVLKGNQKETRNWAFQKSHPFATNIEISGLGLIDEDNWAPMKDPFP